MHNSSDHWPSVFADLKSRLSEVGDSVTIAESWGCDLPQGLCSRTLTCGLARESEYECVTGDIDLGHEVQASGPHPFPRGEEYEPRFWIFGTPAIPDGIEPLVPSWKSNNRTVQQPDPGLLMTYGLIPRINKDSGIIHWDDLCTPRHDVIVATPVSVYDNFLETSSSVMIRRDYLQDYASLRMRSVICVFYERWLLGQNEELSRLLAGSSYREWRYRDAYIRVQMTQSDDPKCHLDIWGHRLLIRPGFRPISEDAEHCGELSWPGVPEAISDETWRGHHATFVYVMDTVLGRFEGRPEYQIHPESGSLRYGHQWGISHCDRVGRDLLRVEVKKLYEGTPPDIVRHYHSHAVNPPAEKVADLQKERNIATRSHDVVIALCQLGEAMANLANRLDRRSVSSKEFVSLDAQQMRSIGWWNAGSVEPICRHVPISATRDAFVGRCKDLYQVIGEGLQEHALRRLLISLGISSTTIGDLKSLKLLCRLIDLACLAGSSGLDLVSDRDAVIARIQSPADPSPCRHLFALNEARQLDAHRQGSSFPSKLETVLKKFGIDAATVVPGYGRAIDVVYEKIETELQACTRALRTAWTSS